MSNRPVPVTYADQFVDWLVDIGYTHCFFVAGGNVMHLLNSARTRLECVPVVHEVAAGIAAEYFNATRASAGGRAFALVTAGPGLTNILTAISGAFLESRELLVIGGQVKSMDLASGGIRQRGIQEINGVAMAEPVCVETLQLRTPVLRQEIERVVAAGIHGRPGPVFIEFCLDAQAAAVVPDASLASLPIAATSEPTPQEIAGVAHALTVSERPVLLMGGGLSRDAVRASDGFLREIGIPIMTSWNALDRVAYDDPRYLGRPDTWGMRWANVLIQQADLILAVGARLGLQQTGFNWQAFAPSATVIHVDIDKAELSKGHPHVEIPIHADAGAFLVSLAQELSLQPDGIHEAQVRWQNWLEFGREVESALPLDDADNETNAEFLSPYRFVELLSAFMTTDDILVPCSSGGASTVLMQAFKQKRGQLCVNSKALASMGYGLSGAIGVALANPGRRVITVEGDGGFAQNLQEIGTVAAQSLNLKMFIYENQGYASIRMTQRNYFDGAYVGCDVTTGLGLPDWQTLFRAWGIEMVVVDTSNPFSGRALDLLTGTGPAAFLVPLDPEQTYFPKITSRVTESGSMKSNPIHLMSPELSDTLKSRVYKYID